MKISVFYEHIVEASAQTGKSVSEICRLAASYGIRGVEIEDKRLFGENYIVKEKILTDLKEADMEISCIYGFYDFSHEDKIQRAYDLIDNAYDLGIKKIMPIPGFIQENEAEIYKECLDKMIYAMNQICSYAKEKKIMVVLEDFDDKIAHFSNAKGLKYFMDQVPDLYCTFDTGNFLYSEEDSLEVLPMFLDKIGHVHCKDRSLTEVKGEEFKATIAGRNMFSSPVGSGIIKMREIIEKIKESGYDDYFAIEHFGSLDQLGFMKKSAEWLNGKEFKKI